MTPSTHPADHPGDDELLNWLNGEVTPTRFDEIAADIDQCTVCRGNLDALLPRLPSLHSHSPIDTIPMPPPRSPPPPPWPAIPNFQILGILDRGGMGIVYRAWDRRASRQVALKMIHPEFPLTTSAVQGLLTEARLAASLTHPNIVPIWEVDQNNGQPYFSMELVNGGSLAAVLGKMRESGGLPCPRDSAQLLATVALAVQCAHKGDVLHRDLKPGNILLRFPDDTGKLPLNQRIPLVADFGLARTLQSAGSVTGVIVGTPSYMPPEQARGSRFLNEQADIYALGAILYEMLTGRPPFKSDNPIDTIRQVTEQEPVPPRQVQRNTPRLLETICLKCLEKSPDQRYSRAKHLAEDLECYLAGYPLKYARSRQWWEPYWRWVQRNPMVASLAAALVLVLVGGIALSTTQAVRANENATKEKKQRELAEANEKKAQDALHLADMARHGLQINTAWHAWKENDLNAARKALNGKHILESFGQTWVRRHCLELCDRKAQQLMNHAAVTAVACSHDGTHIVSGSDDKVQLWTEIEGKWTSRPLPGHAASVTSVAISARGERIVSGSADGKVIVWSNSKGWTRRILGTHEAGVTCVAITANGKKVASASQVGKFAPRPPVKLWDPENGQLWELPGHKDQVNSIAFNPDGTLLVSGAGLGNAPKDKSIKVWDVKGVKLLDTLEGHDDSVRSVAFSPDGNYIVSGSLDGTVKVWKAKKNGRIWVAVPAPLDSLKGQATGVSSVAVMSGVQGKLRIVSGGFDGTVKFWDPENKKNPLTLTSHIGTVRNVAFLDGIRIVSGSKNKTLTIWKLGVEQASVSKKGHDKTISGVAVSANGERIVSGGDDKKVKVWDTATLKFLQTLDHGDRVNSVAVSANGKRIVSGGDDKKVKVWDAATLKLLQTVGHSDPVNSVAISRDGTRIVSGSGDPRNPFKPGEVKVWDAATGKILSLKGHTNSVTSVAITPDGKWVAAGSAKKVIVWDASTGEHKWTRSGHTEPVQGLAINRAGDRLVSASADNTLCVWNLDTGKLLHTLEGHTEVVNGVAFSPNGKRIVSASADKRIKVWDAETGVELLTLEGHLNPVTCVAVTGNSIVSGSTQGNLKLWSAPAATR